MGNNPFKNFECWSFDHASAKQVQDECKELHWNIYIQKNCCQIFQQDTFLLVPRVLQNQLVLNGSRNGRILYEMPPLLEIGWQNLPHFHVQEEVFAFQSA